MTTNYSYKIKIKITKVIFFYFSLQFFLLLLFYNYNIYIYKWFVLKRYYNHIKKKSENGQKNRFDINKQISKKTDQLRQKKNEDHFYKTVLNSLSLL